MYVEHIHPSSLPPDNLLAPAKRVMSLKEPYLKMSKSHPDPRSRIHINDNPDLIGDKVRLALTDSVAGVSFDPEKRPGVSNLLNIMSCLDGRSRSAEAIAQSCTTMSMREFKAEATGVICEGLANIQERYLRLLNADAAHYLDDVAVDGSKRARRQAEQTMAALRQVIGLQ